MKKTTMLLVALVCIFMLSVGSAFAANQVAHSNAITEDAALNFALVDAGVKEKDAFVKKTDFDFEKGKYVYEIEFIANDLEYEYDINASNGKVVKKDVEPVKTTQKTAKNATQKTKKAKKAAQTTTTQKAAANQKATADQNISVDKAKSIALANAGKKAGDVTFSKAKLERDDGRWVYDIEFYVTGQNEYEYEIDAATGTILDSDIELWEAYDD